MATLLTINKGKSLTLGFIFPDSYDMNRIKDVKVYVGSSFYPYSIAGKVLTCKLTSEQTSLLFSLTKIAIWIDDNKIGGDPIILGDIQVVSTNVATTSQSVNEGFDLLFNLTITEDTITIDTVYYNVSKGDSAFAIWLQQPGNAGKTEQDYINFLKQPAIDAATQANTAAANVEIAENDRVTAENDRVTAEGERVAAESKRVISESDRVTAESERATNESGRVSAESARVTAESVRVESENARVTAERGRATTESSRVTDENARITAESGRVTAESDRAMSESERVASENARVTVESGRVTAESNRVTAENSRATAESNRATAENSRVTAENSRATAESARASNETTRQTNETTRASNETTRQSNEASRQTNETTRQSNESTRQSQEASRVAAENQRVASGSIIANQSTPQTLGSSSARLIKLWATDIESTNIPTVGGVDLRTALGVTFPQYFDIKAKGDGSGVLQMDITVLYACTATITGGYFYSDVNGTTGQSTTKSLAAGDVSIYMKTSSNATVFVPGLTKIRSGNASGTNIPALSNMAFSPLINYCSIYSIDNTIGGTLIIPPGCTCFQLTGSNTVSGALTIPSGCTVFTLRGNTTVSGVLTIPSMCTNFVLYGANTVSGTLAIPSSCAAFLLGGSNTVSGTLIIPSGCGSIECSGGNTLSFNLTNTPDATKYIVLNSPAGGNYTYNTSSGQKTWAQGMREVFIRPKSGVWTSAMTDALLIDLSSVTTWTYEKTIDLRGNCGAKTSASSNAVSTLQGNGVTVLTN